MESATTMEPIKEDPDKSTAIKMEVKDEIAATPRRSIINEC